MEPLGGGIKPRYLWTMAKHMYGIAPTLADIDEIAREVLAALPDEFRRFAGEVVIRIEEFTDEETEKEMGLESPFELSGLYQGVPIGDKGVGATAHDVDMILLYRRPLLDEWCETGEDLTHLIRHVMIHEIGHHFGFSDSDMARLEIEADRSASGGEP